MLMIRLQRTGRRNEPTFRVVLTDSKNAAKSGKSLEVMGSYDSRRGEKAEINFERVKHWMSQGAQLSGTIHNLLVSKKLIPGKKINVLPKKRPIKKEGDAPAADAAAPADATPAEVAPEATPEAAPTEAAS
jgi:small subunit ribosomal protein S16